MHIERVKRLAGKRAAVLLVDPTDGVAGVSVKSVGGFDLMISGNPPTYTFSKV